MVGNSSAGAAGVVIIAALHATIMAPHQITGVAAAAAVAEETTPGDHESRDGRRRLRQREQRPEDDSQLRLPRPRPRRVEEKKRRAAKLKNILLEPNSDDHGGSPQSFSREEYLYQYQQSMLPLLYEDEDEQNHNDGQRSDTSEECSQRQWHPDPASVNKNNGVLACTNSLDYPSSWDQNSNVYETVMFDSSEDCCSILIDGFGNELLKGECSVVDDCAASSSSSQTSIENDVIHESEVSSTALDATINALQQHHHHQQLKQQQHQQQQQQLQRSLSGCSPHGWHAEMATNNRDGCSNDDVYPVEWTSDSMKPMMFFSSYRACCDTFFAGRTCKEYACGKEGAPEPPAPSPPGGGSNSKCAWHADMKHQDGCSNDDNYPSDWLQDQMRVHMFHASHQDCCKAIFVGRAASCKKYDLGCTKVVEVGKVTKQPTPPPTPPPIDPNCVIPGWHAEMSTGLRDGCANDDNFPSDWLQSGLKQSMFFPTSKACCDQFFANKPCKVYQRGCRIDASLLEECDVPNYHPDKKKGNTYVGCTNDAEYPKEWVGRRNWEFASAMECCKKFHDGNGRCPVREGCTDRVSYLDITKAPTKRPTKHPTNTPTKRPTAEPTNKPTSSPTTSAPTVREPKFYIVHGVGTCANDKVVPPPFYITTFYADMPTCCHFSWANDKCIAEYHAAEGITSPPVGTPTLAPSPIPSTEIPVPDTVVEISTYGSLRIEYLEVSSRDSGGRSKLKDALTATLYSVMVSSPMVHSNLAVMLSSYGGQSFPSSADRTLIGEVHQKRYYGEFENDEANQRNVPSSKSVTNRRLSVAQTLQFEMIIPARCNERCQTARGHTGMVAFNEIKSHFEEYVTGGVLSSSLTAMGISYGLLTEESEHPYVVSGTLSYRFGSVSSATWTPTFYPTVALPTVSPTMDPTENPTEEVILTLSPSSAPDTGEPTAIPTAACSMLRWHYGGEGICTNNPNYPRLWDLRPDIGARFLYASLEECCAANSPEGCFVSDTCEVASTSSITYCDARSMMYHPTTPSKRTCTNSKEYPAAWDHNDGFLFVSPQDCCAAYYSGECYIKNVCY